MLSMERAFDAMIEKITNSNHNVDKITSIYIDGNTMPKININSPNILIKTIIGGDRIVKEISAASIIAKVIRDKIMIQLHEKHPEYSFDKNVGYGTRNHIDAIKKYGPTKHHRMSFLGNIIKS
jgi:ribonuclease HII